MRNLFEDNEPIQDIDGLGDNYVTILPRLNPGEKYELVTIGDGRTAVIISKG